MTRSFPCFEIFGRLIVTHWHGCAELRCDYGTSSDILEMWEP